MQRQRDWRPLCANPDPRNIIDENDHNTKNASGFDFFGHAARRPEGELFKDLVLLTQPRMGKHDQGRRGTTLQAASRQPRTMEKGLGERIS